jgi:hypothetical protein
MNGFAGMIVTGVTSRCQRIGAGWNRFWFTPADPTTLGAVRICTGLVLLYAYLTCSSELLSYIGPNAWMDAAALDEIRRAEGKPIGWWGWSIYFVAQEPWMARTIHAAFLAAIGCFTVGLFTRTASVLVWAGHLSFVHRAYLSWSGLDSVLAMLTFYLMFAPSGAAVSVDNVRRRKRGGKGAPGPRWDANFATRLIQIHMCVIYLCAGLGKLQGGRWWDGTAIWSVMTMHEFALFDVTWLGRFGDTFCLLVSNVGVLLTLGFEISFAFLIWNPSVRPILLGLAVILHAGIGLLMGMSAFGMAMLAGCLAFVAPTAVRAFVERCVSLVGAMRRDHRESHSHSTRGAA